MENCKHIDIKIRTLIEDLKNGTILRSPEWQRGSVWTDKDRRDFMDTVLGKFPIPQIALWKKSPGEYVVVDGRQRITAIEYFIDNKIPHLTLKTGRAVYSDLTDTEKRVFLDISVPVLEFPNHPDVGEEDIVEYFQRLNGGGKKLSHGELIHSHCTTSPLVKEINNVFFTDNAFLTEWTEMFTEGIAKHARMAHLENTLPYLTSSITGNAEYLTKSYPIIARLMKISQEEIDAHHEIFLANLRKFLSVFWKILEHVPNWVDDWNDNGLPPLRQVSAIWLSIIVPSLMKGHEHATTWSAFYARINADSALKNRWELMMRKNNKAGQLRKEIDFVIETTA
jgi:hypothetical protein